MTSSSLTSTTAGFMAELRAAGLTSAEPSPGSRTKATSQPVSSLLLAVADGRGTELSPNSLTPSERRIWDAVVGKRERQYSVREIAEMMMKREEVKDVVVGTRPMSMPDRFRDDPWNADQPKFIPTPFAGDYNLIRDHCSGPHTRSVECKFHFADDDAVCVRSLLVTPHRLRFDKKFRLFDCHFNHEKRWLTHDVEYVFEFWYTDNTVPVEPVHHWTEI